MRERAQFAVFQRVNLAGLRVGRGQHREPSILALFDVRDHSRPFDQPLDLAAARRQPRRILPAIVGHQEQNRRCRPA